LFEKSHPFCLKMLLFVWVTCRKPRLGAVVSGLLTSVSLGALICNGMRLCLYFLFLTYCFWMFKNYYWTKIYETFMMRPWCQRLFLWCWTNSAAKFWNTYVEWSLMDKLLFIQFMKCSIPFQSCWTLILNENFFYVGKTGCYNWYQSRSVRPAK
jgi:hypothetical protein